MVVLFFLGALVIALCAVLIAILRFLVFLVLKSNQVSKERFLFWSLWLVPSQPVIIDIIEKLMLKLGSVLSGILPEVVGVSLFCIQVQIFFIFLVFFNLVSGGWSYLFNLSASIRLNH